MQLVICHRQTTAVAKAHAMLGFFSSFPTEKEDPIFEKLWKNEPTMMENIYGTGRGGRHTGHCALKCW
jgi:hypothetical protein